MNFPILRKLAAIQAKPDLKIQAPQPIAPLTDPSQAQSSVGAAAVQAGPGGAGAFPSGPQSLHAGQPDQSAAMAEQAKLQEAQIKEQERQQKVQEELHKTRNELVQTKAEAVKAQAQIDAAKAREDMVTDKEKALDHHTKMIEKARKLESRPTLLSASSDRISKKVEQMGANMKYAHLAFFKCAAGAPAPATAATGAVAPVPEPGVSAPGAPTGIATNGVPQVRNYDNKFVPASQFVPHPAPAAPPTPAPAATTAPAPAARPMAEGQANPGFIQASNPAPVNRPAPPSAPAGAGNDQLTQTLLHPGPTAPGAPVAAPGPGGIDEATLQKQLPGLKRFMPNTYQQVLSGTKTMDQAKLMLQKTQGLRNQMMTNQVNIDYMNDPNSEGARNLEGFINTNPDFYRKGTDQAGFFGGHGVLGLASGNHVWNNAADYGLGVDQDVARNEYLGGQAYGQGDYLEAARRAGDTTGTIFNNVIAPASLAGGLGATRSLANFGGVVNPATKLSMLPWLARGAGRAAGETGLSYSANPLDHLSQWNHDGNAEYGQLDQRSRAWQVGDQHLSPEEELNQANGTITSSYGNPMPQNGGGIHSADDLQSLQRTGYFHQDQFTPMENWRTQFNNPYINGGYHMLAPMFYPGVNMRPYNGQSGGFDPMGRMQSMAQMLPQQMMR